MKMKQSPRPRAKERFCDNAIKNTLAYRAVFKYPMSFYQLGTFLISDKILDYEIFSKELNKLCKNRSVKVKGGKYYLTGFKPISWQLRTKNTFDQIRKILPIIEILRAIPWIKMCAITGSAAAYNLSSKDDIDIFIITSQKRLWVTRLFTVILLKILGKYRTNKNPTGKICPNIFIDETDLTWDKNKQNIYVAHEILMMHPVINRDRAYFNFLNHNLWVFDHFTNMSPEKGRYDLTGRDKIIKSKFMDFIEGSSRIIQYLYMEKKRTNEIIKKNFIHFNKTDNTKKILNEYESFYCK